MTINGHEVDALGPLDECVAIVIRGGAFDQAFMEELCDYVAGRFDDRSKAPLIIHLSVPAASIALLGTAELLRELGYPERGKQDCPDPWVCCLHPLTDEERRNA